MRTFQSKQQQRNAQADQGTPSRGMPGRAAPGMSAEQQQQLASPQPSAVMPNRTLARQQGPVTGVKQTVPEQTEQPVTGGRTAPLTGAAQGAGGGAAPSGGRSGGGSQSGGGSARTGKKGSTASSSHGSSHKRTAGHDNPDGSGRKGSRGDKPELTTLPSESVVVTQNGAIEVEDPQPKIYNEYRLPLDGSLTSDDFTIKVLMDVFGVDETRAWIIREKTHFYWIGGPIEITKADVENNSKTVRINAEYLNKVKPYLPALDRVVELNQLIGSGDSKESGHGLLNLGLGIGVGDLVFGDPGRETAQAALALIGKAQKDGEWNNMSVWLDKEAVMSRLIAFDPMTAVQASKMGIAPGAGGAGEYSALADYIVSVEDKFGGERADFFALSLLKSMGHDDLDKIIKELNASSRAHEILPHMPHVMAYLKEQGIDLAAYPDRKENPGDAVWGGLKSFVPNPFKPVASELDYWRSVERLPESERKEAIRLGKEHIISFLKRKLITTLLDPGGSKEMAFNLFQQVEAGINDMSEGNYRAGMEKLTPVIVMLISMGFGGAAEAGAMEEGAAAESVAGETAGTETAASETAASETAATEEASTSQEGLADNGKPNNLEQSHEHSSSGQTDAPGGTKTSAGPETAASSGETAVVRYDPRFAIRTNPLEALRSVIRNGRLKWSELKKFVPEGTSDTFQSTARLTDGEKYVFRVDGKQIEIRYHSFDPKAALEYPGSNAGSGYTAQIKIGKKLLGSDGNLYSKPTNVTHIPLDF